MSEPLPAGWTQACVGDLARADEQPVLTGPFGTSMGREDFVSEGCPVLTIGCLTDAGIRLDKAVYVRADKAVELDRYKLQTGDLLFSRMASVGRAGMVPATLEGALFNYHIMRLRLSETIMLPELFLAYVRGAPAVSKYLEEVNHGATRDGINTAQLVEMPVTLPPLNEQRRIVAQLEVLQARGRRAREALEAVPPLLEKLRQSILAAAFCGDLTEDWRATPGKLGAIAKFIDYRGRTPTKTDAGVPLITAKNVRRGFLSATPKEYIADADYMSWMTRGFPKACDVLITTEAPLGNVVCIDWSYKFALAQRVICLQPDATLVSGPFLALMMQSPNFQARLVDRSTGTTVAGIKASRLKELEVPLPALSEQHRLARLVTTMLERVARLGSLFEGELVRVELLERAVLAKAFRGELVPQDPNDEPAEAMLARVRGQNGASAANGAINSTTVSPRRKKRKVRRAQVRS